MRLADLTDPDGVETSTVDAVVDAGYAVTSVVRLPAAPSLGHRPATPRSLRMELRDPESGREHVARLLRLVGGEDRLWVSTQGWVTTGVLPSRALARGGARVSVLRYLTEVDGDGTPTRGSSIGARNADLVRAAEVRGTLSETTLAAVEGHSVRDLLDLYEVHPWDLVEALPVLAVLASGAPAEWAFRRAEGSAS